MLDVVRIRYSGGVSEIVSISTMLSYSIISRNTVPWADRLVLSFSQQMVHGKNIFTRARRDDLLIVLAVVCQASQVGIISYSNGSLI